jgi:hydroxymethylbilane synthase
VNEVVFGTRGSDLALAQAKLARQRFESIHPDVSTQEVVITTSGDSWRPEQAPVSGGGKGLFTREIESALLAERIDVAVHSLKDLPAAEPDGLLIGAVLPRADPADVLILRNRRSIDELTPGAILATSSIRRTRHLLWARPDLNIQPLHGNVPTRLRYLANDQHIAGIVLARAGLDRLGIATLEGSLAFETFHFSTEDLSPIMLPAIGQGIVALQCRAADTATRERLARIDDPTTAIIAAAERALLRLLDGDCDLPIGVRTSHTPHGLHMEAWLFPPSSTGAPVIAAATAITPEDVARSVFNQLL